MKRKRLKNFTVLFVLKNIWDGPVRAFLIKTNGISDIFNAAIRDKSKYERFATVSFAFYVKKRKRYAFQKNATV